MVEKIKTNLRTSEGARWIVLGLVSFTMLTGYIVTDLMAPLEILLNSGLGWEAADFGIFNAGYGLLNVFLFMLIFGGIILDRIGPRFTGLLAVVIMLVGTFIKYWAISTDFGGEMVTWSVFGKTLFSLKAQVFYATLGFAIFGVGIELIGITASKIVIKWFKGGHLALAMGLNVAAGRIGTGIALTGALRYAKFTGSISAPIALSLILLCIGLLAFIIFVMIDAKADKEVGESGYETAAEEEKFRLRDIVSIARLRGFWLLTLLCLLFYSAVFPFLKFATAIMVIKFGVAPDWAGVLAALVVFGNILLTPVFGVIYDYKGKGATIMIIGSVMLIVVHLLFSVPMLTQWWIAFMLMILLGGAFSLVPSAMWPSVPKIIPYNKLGTAYAMIFWIQNIGLAGTPALIGWVMTKYCVTGQVVIDGELTTAYDYSLPMMIFAGLGIASLFVGMLLKREDARKQYGLELPNIKR